jgi:hypothetical protein
MLGSSLPPVVCRRTHVLFTYVICVCLRTVLSNTYCFVLCFCFVLLRLVYPMLPVSLDCHFLIAPSVFSNVYLSVSLDCHFLNASSVFSNVYLFCVLCTLCCQFLWIVTSVFSNVYLVSLDCHFLSLFGIL